VVSRWVEVDAEILAKSERPETGAAQIDTYALVPPETKKLQVPETKRERQDYRR